MVSFMLGCVSRLSRVAAPAIVPASPSTRALASRGESHWSLAFRLVSVSFRFVLHRSSAGFSHLYLVWVPTPLVASRSFVLPSPSCW